MRCLSCWLEIEAPRIPCSDAAFSRELACPLCDTVLPKDGVVEFDVRPDASALRDIGAATIGLNPHDMCEVLRAGLDFWEQHRKNEDSRRQAQARASDADRDKAVDAVRKVSAALEQEKMASHGLRAEVAALQRDLADVQRKYAEKSRAARKAADRYGDLRRVHRRLQADLLGSNAAAGADGNPQSPPHAASVAAGQRAENGSPPQRTCRAAAAAAAAAPSDDSNWDDGVRRGQRRRPGRDCKREREPVYIDRYRNCGPVDDGRSCVAAASPAGPRHTRPRTETRPPASAARPTAGSFHAPENGPAGPPPLHERAMAAEAGARDLVPARLQRRSPADGDSRVANHHLGDGAGKENDPAPSRSAASKARKGAAAAGGMRQNWRALSPRAKVFDLNPGLRKRHEDGLDKPPPAQRPHR